MSPQIVCGANPPDRKALAKWNEQQARAEALLAEGKTSKALEEATKALSLVEHVGRDFPELVETLELIGGIQAGNAQHADAIVNLNRAVRIREAAQGKSVDLLESMSMLGQSLLAMGKFDDANQLGASAVAIAESHYTDSDVRLAEVYALVGLGHFIGNDLQRSESLLAKSLGIYDRASVVDGQTMVPLLSSLGTVRILLGQHGGAEAALSRVMSDVDAIPNFHPTEQIFMAGLLLESVAQQGKSREASALKQRIRRIFGTLPKAEQESYIRTTNMLGEQWKGRGWTNGVNAIEGLVLTLNRG